MKSDSVAFAEKLLEDGVIVKPWKQQGYTTFIRVSVGAPEENDLFMRSFEKPQDWLEFESRFREAVS